MEPGGPVPLFNYATAGHAEFRAFLRAVCSLAVASEPFALFFSLSNCSVRLCAPNACMSLSSNSFFSCSSKISRSRGAADDALTAAVASRSLVLLRVPQHEAQMSAVHRGDGGTPC